MSEITLIESHLTVEDAIRDLKASAKEGEITALLEAQVYLAFGDFGRAAETVQNYFDANPEMQEKVKPGLNALLDSIKTVEGQYKALFSQYSALETAAATNYCGICTPSVGGNGIWTIDPVTKKKVCMPC
jgi:hypothetical protein